MAQRKQQKAARYHHGDLKRGLLDAALALIEEEGVKELSLREVARRSGVTHAAPYRHFADKQALLAAVAEEGFRLMDAGMRARMAPARDALKRFRLCGVAYVEFAVDHPAHFRVMFGGQVPDFTSHAALLDASACTFGLLVQCVEQGQASRQLAPGPPLPIALTAWSTVHGLASLLVENQLAQLGLGREDAERLAMEQTEKLLEGLKAS